MKKLSLIILSLLFIACKNTNQGNNLKPTGEKPDSSKSNSSVVTSNDTDFDSSNFISYWKVFRQAVLQSDSNKLISLTEFPLYARGSLDDDPQLEYSRKQFPRVFHFFLVEEYDLIKDTEMPKDEVVKNQISVGDMTFFLIDKKWKLNFLYLDYDTIDSIEQSK